MILKFWTSKKKSFNKEHSGILLVKKYLYIYLDMDISPDRLEINKNKSDGNSRS